MKTERIEDIESLIRMLNGFEGTYVFRGQSDAGWKLQSSLERIIGHDKYVDRVNIFEDYALMEFKKRFALYSRTSFLPNSLLSWLSAMQHYGVPTRLLDFSESPYVALYFALESYDVLSHPDFSLYAFNYREFMEISLDLVKMNAPSFDESVNSLYTRSDSAFEAVMPMNLDILWFTEPLVYHERLDKQRGCFLVSMNKMNTVEKLLTLPSYSTCSSTKFIISNKLYGNAYSLLKTVNVTSKSIYGDIEGLAHSLRMDLQFYSN